MGSGQPRSTQQGTKAKQDHKERTTLEGLPCVGTEPNVLEFHLLWAEKKEKSVVIDFLHAGSSFLSYYENNESYF